MQGIFLILLAVHAVNGAFGGLIGRMQSSGAFGTLLCNGRPEPGVVVKLYDDDRGVDMDDFMGETKTDKQGYFKVTGHLREMSSIDPKLNIYHDCNDNLKPCQRKFSIMLPDGYITNEKDPKKLYDVGRMELAGKMAGETRDCLH